MNWPWNRKDDWLRGRSDYFDKREREFERRSAGGPSGSSILYFVLGGFTMLLVMFFVGATMEAILGY